MRAVAGRPAARAAVAAVDRRGQQPGLVDDADALGREVGGAVVALGVRREGAGDLGQPRQVDGRYIDHFDGHNRDYAGRARRAASVPLVLSAASVESASGESASVESAGSLRRGKSAKSKPGG